MTRFVGPSENWGPIHLLRETDRLLLLAGWVRKGTDPNTINDPLNRHANSGATDALDYTFGPFGYQHPTSGEVLWFKAVLHWFHRTTDNLYQAVLAIALLPVSIWTPADPPQTYHLSVSYEEANFANRSCEWVVGGGSEGFYILQTQGSKAGGFAVERVPETGQWLLQYVDNQWRNGSALGLNIQTIKGNALNTNTWYSEALDGVLLQVTPGSTTKYVGLVSYLSLEFTAWGANAGVEDNSGGAALTPDGVLLRGPWAHVNTYKPVLSNLLRRYFPPAGLVQSVEEGVVKTFTRVTSVGTAAQLLWRKS